MIIYNATQNPTDINRDNDANFYGPFFQYFTAMNTKTNLNRSNLWRKTESCTVDARGVKTCKKSTNVNDIASDGSPYYKNIFVNITNLGSWGQWSTTNSKPLAVCMYDVQAPEEEYGPTDLIFRPIDLGNVFPGDGNEGLDGRGRNPRFNWTGHVNRDGTTTGAALLKGYDPTSNEYSLYLTEDVNPEKLTETIQKKNESIYDPSKGEVEYEFTLTPENMKNIRKYNKEKGTYLNYEMDCAAGKTGKNKTKAFAGCISHMVSNSSYVTFSSGYSTGQRWQIASCNTATSRGTQCDTSINTQLVNPVVGGGK